MEKSPADFYDGIETFYDQMTQSADRLAGEKDIMKLWIEAYQFANVLDAACGSGIHAIVLSQLGISVSGADISAQMIRKATNNARRTGVKIRFRTSAFKNLGQEFKEKFDHVLILGNSLPHITNTREMANSLNGIKNVLTEHGRLIVQILNYEQILKTRQRIIAVTRNNTHEYIRFYDFDDQLIRFNILHIDWNNGTPLQQMFSTMLYPYTIDELTKIFITAGFRIRDLFGSMKFDPFDPEKSKNLVLVAERK